MTTATRLAAARQSLGHTQNVTCPQVRRQALLLAMIGFRHQFGLTNTHRFMGFSWASYCWTHKLGKAYQPFLKG